MITKPLKLLLTFYLVFATGEVDFMFEVNEFFIL